MTRTETRHADTASRNDLSVHTRGPLARTEGSPLGERQYFEMTAGTLTGERINATIAMPGGDWMSRSPDGFWRPDVRVQLVTDDAAITEGLLISASELEYAIYRVG